MVKYIGRVTAGWREESNTIFQLESPEELRYKINLPFVCRLV